MIDLVTRLRQRLGDAWKLNDEAADEIERLRKDRLCRCADEVRCEMRAEIERLKAQIALEQEYSEDLCKKGAEQEAEIERMHDERDFWKESRDFRVKEHLADKAEIKRLRAVVDAAKDMTSERACWNPDTGCYDLYKSNGTLEQLIEALDALEDDDE